MKRILALVCMLAMLVGLGAVLTTQSHAKPPKGDRVSVKGVESKTRGEDPNIKNDHEKNDKNAKPAAPHAKGGKTRGSDTGIIHIDNQTGWYVRCYANGDYIGTVGPYGDLRRYAETGTFTMFARAPFDDSPDLTFGPTTLKVYGDTTSSWTLTD